MQDFSGGPVVKSLPANAEDMGSILGPGGFRMPPKLLSPFSTARVATTMRTPQPQLEKSSHHEATKTQCSQKEIIFFLKKEVRDRKKEVGDRKKERLLCPGIPKGLAWNH